jgi:hypothetical protein
MDRIDRESTVKINWPAIWSIQLRTAYLCHDIGYKLGINFCNRVDPLSKVLSSGVASDPKDSKFFFLLEESLFQGFYMNFIYEIGIVTFQKILIGGYLYFLFLKVGKKIKLIIDQN